MNFCLPAGFEESAVLSTIPRGLLASSGVCLHSSHAALLARIHHDLYCPPQVRITIWKPFSNLVILIWGKKVIYFEWYCHLGDCNSASYWDFAIHHLFVLFSIVLINGLKCVPVLTALGNISILWCLWREGWVIVECRVPALLSEWVFESVNG